MPTGRRVAISVLTAAALGLSMFGLMAWQAVSVQQIDPNGALQEFGAVRARMKGAPLVRRDESGRFERRVTAPGDSSASTLHVLAYHVSGRQLVRADVPFWFFKAKGPAVEYALRGTDFDLASLNLTPGELQAEGPCLVIDYVRSNGDRLIAWTN
jgi:hypothetical protein